MLMCLPKKEGAIYARVKVLHEGFGAAQEWICRPHSALVSILVIVLCYRWTFKWMMRINRNEHDDR